MTRHFATIRRYGMLAALAGLAACSADEKIIYRETPKFTPPPAEAKGYLGYEKADQKLTVCGTCHAGLQQEWQRTGHAMAWDGMENSGHAAEYCEGCHTVGNLGNGVTDPEVGWAGSHDVRYYDVQCESCHGPGESHATNMGSARHPLASANAYGDVSNPSGCGACHQGDHHPYAEEWAASPHALMPWTTDPAEDPPHIIEGAGTDCQGCHTGEYALRKDMNDPTKIGFRANVKMGYKEAKHDPKANDFMRITCVVCHDPHGDANPAQLRFKVAVADTLENLCIRCHNRRAVPGGTWRGPHSGEGQLVLGLNSGWRPPGMAPFPAQIAGSHASVANTNGCATCHMDDQAVDGIATTGHLFLGTPCMEGGKPTNKQDCSLQERNFNACATGGCHGSANVARSLTMVSEQRLASLMSELKTLLENTSKVACAEFDYAGGKLTPARGARFNYLLAAGHTHQHEDACSAGAPSGAELRRALPEPEPGLGAVVHNPAYIEQLLRGSIAAVKAQYYR